VKDPAERKTAAEMLLHPFLAHCKSNLLLEELVSKCHTIALQRGYGIYEDEDDHEFDSEPEESSAGVTDVNESGTWVTKSNEDEGETPLPKRERRRKKEKQAKNESKESKLDKPDKPKKEIDDEFGAGTYMDESGTSKHKYGLQDELTAIYRKDCTIRIPFLSVSCLDPKSLLSTNSEDNDLRSILTNLTADPALVPPFSPNALPPTLGNLVKTLGTYKKGVEDGGGGSASNEEQRKTLLRNQQVITDLTTTLKTVFRL